MWESELIPHNSFQHVTVDGDQSGLVRALCYDIGLHQTNSQSEHLAGGGEAVYKRLEAVYKWLEASPVGNDWCIIHEKNFAGDVEKFAVCSGVNKQITAIQESILEEHVSINKHAK